MMISCLVSKITLFDCVRNMKIHYCILGGLFHILWQNPAVVKLMKFELSQCGFTSSLFDYSSFANFVNQSMFFNEATLSSLSPSQSSSTKEVLMEEASRFSCFVPSSMVFLWGKAPSSSFVEGVLVVHGEEELVKNP